MTRRNYVLWAYMFAFVLSAIGFIASDFRDDMQGMIFSGFTGAFWFACATRERDKK